MPKTLFVCYGNVFRSQMAQAYYNHFTRTNDAFSAGISSATPILYTALPDVVFAVMREEGIDMIGHRAKTLAPDHVRDAKRIYVLCSRIDCPPFLTSSGKAAYWAVPDPFMTSIDNHRRVRDRIKGLVELILETPIENPSK